MESTNNFSMSQPCLIKTVKSQRSLPIPKQVNTYVLNNYGAQYYNSDSHRKNEILKEIERDCAKSGYLITAMEIERRLKNMKSHYRRKKLELATGTAHAVGWEYFDVLDKIFGDIAKEEGKKNEQKMKESKIVVVPCVKRKPEEDKPAKKEEDNSPKPHDL